MVLPYQAPQWKPAVLPQNEIKKNELPQNEIKKNDFPQSGEKDQRKADPGVEIFIDDDEDDEESLKCIKPRCLKDFWYKSELDAHMKKEHNISDPDKYLKELRMEKIRAEQEEKQRKLAAIRAEQERKYRLVQREKDKAKKRDEEMVKLRKLHAAKVMKKMESDHRDDLLQTFGDNPDYIEF